MQYLLQLTGSREHVKRPLSGEEEEMQEGEEGEMETEVEEAQKASTTMRRHTMKEQQTSFPPRELDDEGDHGTETGKSVKDMYSWCDVCITILSESPFPNGENV